MNAAVACKSPRAALRTLKAMAERARKETDPLTADLLDQRSGCSQRVHYNPNERSAIIEHLSHPSAEIYPFVNSAPETVWQIMKKALRALGEFGQPAPDGTERWRPHHNPDAAESGLKELTREVERARPKLSELNRLFHGRDQNAAMALARTAGRLMAEDPGLSVCVQAAGNEDGPWARNVRTLLNARSPQQLRRAADKLLSADYAHLTSRETIKEYI